MSKITDELIQVEELLGAENTGKKIFHEYMDAIIARGNVEYRKNYTVEDMKRAQQRVDTARTKLRQAQGYEE